MHRINIRDLLSKVSLEALIIAVAMGALAIFFTRSVPYPVAAAATICFAVHFVASILGLLIVSSWEGFVGLEVNSGALLLVSAMTGVGYVLTHA